MKLTKSELENMIREAIREELSTEQLTEASTARWTKKEAPDVAYAVLTDDGSYKNEFLNWNARDRYYTTVKSISKVSRFDCPASAAEAEDMAIQANSNTWGGWRAPMHIIKISNFKDAYFNYAEPEYTIVKTLNF